MYIFDQSFTPKFYKVYDFIKSAGQGDKEQDQVDNMVDHLDCKYSQPSNLKVEVQLKLLISCSKFSGPSIIYFEITLKLLISNSKFSGPRTIALRNQ